MVVNVGDKFEFRSSDKTLYYIDVVNINTFREPDLRYAVDVYINGEVVNDNGDVTFLPENFFNKYEKELRRITEKEFKAKHNLKKKSAIKMSKWTKSDFIWIIAIFFIVLGVNYGLVKLSEIVSLNTIVMIFQVYIACSFALICGFIKNIYFSDNE